MFCFLNRMVMRLMAARSIDDSPQSDDDDASHFMPIAALVVASGGWVGKALVHAGVMPETSTRKRLSF